jgi:hypothetical protein
MSTSFAATFLLYIIDSQLKSQTHQYCPANQTSRECLKKYSSSIGKSQILQAKRNKATCQKLNRIITCMHCRLIEKNLIWVKRKYNTNYNSPEIVTS